MIRLITLEIKRCRLTTYHRAASIGGIYSEEVYEKRIDLLAGAVADYVENHLELRTLPTTDMWDLRDPDEDVDDWDEEEEDW